MNNSQKPAVALPVAEATSVASTMRAMSRLIIVEPTLRMTLGFCCRP